MYVFMCFGKSVMLHWVLWASICSKVLKLLFFPVLACVKTERSGWFSTECETWCLGKSFWLLAQIEWSPCLCFTGLFMMLLRQKTHSRNAIVPSVINIYKHKPVTNMGMNVFIAWVSHRMQVLSDVFYSLFKMSLTGPHLWNYKIMLLIKALILLSYSLQANLFLLAL